MPQIFLSYSREDTTRIEELRLIEDIEENTQHRVWKDINNIQGGDNWLEAIKKELESSIAVVVFVTNGVLNSQWVMFECGYATAWGIRIIPYFSEDIDEKMKSTPLFDFLSQQHGTNDKKELITLISNIDKQPLLQFIFYQEILSFFLDFRIFSNIFNQLILHNNLASASKVLYVISDIFTERLYPKLVDFWLKIHSVLNATQRRNFQQTVDMIHDLRKNELYKLLTLFFAQGLPNNISSMPEFLDFYIRFNEIDKYMRYSFGDDEKFQEFNDALETYKQGKAYKHHEIWVFMPHNENLYHLVADFFEFLREKYPLIKE